MLICINEMNLYLIGQFGDRRTMLGELNWIFTAITDTIAWNTLPRTLFQKLFRQDLLVASLFRNFLLAERVMRSYDCTPVSQPSLPATHQVSSQDLNNYSHHCIKVVYKFEKHSFHQFLIPFLFSMQCGKLGILQSIYHYLSFQIYLKEMCNITPLHFLKSN